jgi:hypothetical protein
MRQTWAADSPAAMRPTDAVTLHEAAAILGCSVSSMRPHVAAGRLRARRERYKHRALPQAEVEALNVELYPWRRPWHVQDAYWVVGRRPPRFMVHLAGGPKTGIARK